MFKSISWQDYLMAAGVLSLGYYVVVIGVFYSRDILHRLKGATVAKGPSDPVPLDRDSKNFMGAISNVVPRKLPIKESLASAEELFIETDLEQLIAANRADSPAADLYDDLQELFAIMEGGPMPRANYVKTIKSLIKKYPGFKGTPVQLEVSRYIYDQLKSKPDAGLTIEEIETLWLDRTEELINQSINNKNQL